MEDAAGGTLDVLAGCSTDDRCVGEVADPSDRTPTLVEPHPAAITARESTVPSRTTTRPRSRTDANGRSTLDGGIPIAMSRLRSLDDCRSLFLAQAAAGATSTSAAVLRAASYLVDARGARRVPGACRRCRTLRSRASDRAQNATPEQRPPHSRQQRRTARLKCAWEWHARLASLFLDPQHLRSRAGPRGSRSRTAGSPLGHLFAPGSFEAEVETFLPPPEACLEGLLRAGCSAITRLP